MTHRFTLHRYLGGALCILRGWLKQPWKRWVGSVGDLHGIVTDHLSPL
jgi:hypothetical protein